MKKLVVLLVPVAFYGVLVSIQPKQLVVETKPVEKKHSGTLPKILGEHFAPIWSKNKKLAAKKAYQDFMAAELQCLSDNVYHEAAFESDEGKLAVAIVTINRVNDPDYPKTICGVVYERHLNPRNHKMTCQFSWTCKRRNGIDHSAYRSAREIARKALIKHIRVAQLDGVTLYHADYVNPDWAEKSQMVEQIGHHIFYREATL